MRVKSGLVAWGCLRLPAPGLFSFSLSHKQLGRGAHNKIADRKLKVGFDALELVACLLDLPASSSVSLSHDTRARQSLRHEVQRTCMRTGGRADVQKRARVRRVASRVAGQRAGHGRIRGKPVAAGVAGGAPAPPPTLAGFSRGISSREHHCFSTVLSGVLCPATIPVGMHAHACQASLKSLHGFNSVLARTGTVRRHTCLYWTDFFSSVAMSCVRAWCSPASRLACSWQASSNATSCCSRSSHSPRRVCSDEHKCCSLRSAVCVPASRACAIPAFCHRHACLARPWVTPVPVRSPARSAQQDCPCACACARQRG